MNVDEEVIIGPRAYIIEVLDVIKREALLKYQRPDGTWTISGWWSFDELKECEK